MNLKIENTNIEFFNSFNLAIKFDSVASAFSFDFYYNPENPQHKALFKPGTYRRCIVEHNGQLLITGTLISDSASTAAAKELNGMGGYSLPGVLEDCNIPVSLYPLQSDGLSLRQIAQKLIKPFSLTMVVDSAVASLMDQVFTTSTADTSQSIKSYLCELASQKNINVTHNPQGHLLFTKAKTGGVPILDIDMSGESGSVQSTICTSMKRSLNGQAMHSSITVIKQADSSGGNAGQSSINNPYATVFRPMVKVQSSGTDNSTAAAARNALSDELKNLKFTLELNTWEIDGQLIMPNNLITVKNPELAIDKKTTLFIESITYTGNEKIDTCTLTCVVPEVYNTATPKNIFL